MTAHSRLSRAPHAVRRYVLAVSQEVVTVFSGALVGVYTTGSLALGGFTPGRSDIDLMAAVDGPETREACLDLAARLDHRRLPCPASGLEFVLYPRAIVTTPSTDAGYFLNLNTGPELAPVADLGSSPVPAFWFVLDRAVTAQSGEAVIGPPAQTLFRVPPAQELLPVVLAAVEAQKQDRSDLLDNVVLNASRALRFAEDGRWYSKVAAGLRTAATPGPFSGLIHTALATHAQGRHDAAPALATPAVDAFLAHVQARLEEAMNTAL
jgi:Nucleotidyltransferase domain